MNTISTHQLRLLAWSRKKSVHAAISWTLLFLLSIGFNTILLLDTYPVSKENGETFLGFFGVIIKDSILLTLSLMIMVSFNLAVLKKGILDRKIFPWWRDGLYLSAVIVSSIAFTWIFQKIENEWRLIRVSMDFQYKSLIYFAFSLISTGFVYMRELYEKRRALLKSLFKQHGLKEELEQLFGEMEDLQQEVDSLQEKLENETKVAKDHVKIGTKESWEIIRFKDVLCIQGDGNKTKIFAHGKEPFGSSMRMIDFEEQLPKSLFLKVHKSFIINKTKVLKRQNGYFYLNGLHKPIPIGDTHNDLIESDPHLGFLKNRINHLQIE